MGRMKCIVCEQPHRLILKEAESPSLQEGEALVRIRRVGVCGTDLHAYRGNQPYFTYPRVLGHELSGEIVRIGGNPYGLQAGDQVAVIPYMECGTCIACRNGKTNCCTNLQVLGVHIDGGMREMISVPFDHVLKTEGISLDQSALLEPLSIGAHAVRRSGLRQDEFALVIGAGPIGLGVMAFAARSGAKVIAMDVNEDRLAFCRNWAGIPYTVDARSNPLAALYEMTNGDLPTVVFDATGNAQSMGDSFQFAAHGGKLVFVGLVKADITFSDPDFHKKELTLMGSRNATREDMENVMDAIKNNDIDTSAYITHRVGFEQMVGEFEKWLRPESGVIKAIVEW